MNRAVNPLLSDIFSVPPPPRRTSRRAAAQTAKEHISSFYGKPTAAAAGAEAAGIKPGQPRPSRRGRKLPQPATPLKLPSSPKPPKLEAPPVRVELGPLKLSDSIRPAIRPLTEEELRRLKEPFLKQLLKQPRVVLQSSSQWKHLKDPLLPEVRQILSGLYYDHTQAAGLSSPLKLYRAAKKKLPHITFGNILQWLSKQRTYTAFRIPKRKFKRRKVVVRGMGIQYQADLLDMSAKRDASDFILTVIDCFSRFADAVPIGQKTMDNVQQGFEKIFFSRMKVPKKLQTDDGVEFFNRRMKAYFEKLGIIHFSTDQELKASIVERFNRTLREKINKYCAANNTLYYHDALPGIIKAYNRTLHRSLGGHHAPIDVTKHNEPMIREIQYGAYLTTPVSIPKFRVGEIVRVAAFRKGLKKLKRYFKDTLHVITKVQYTRPITYKVKERDSGFQVKGLYYEPQLLSVNKPPSS